VVRPHNEAEGSNANHGENHAEIAKNRLAGECRDNVANNAEGWHDDDVDFGVPKEPQ